MIKSVTIQNDRGKEAKIVLAQEEPDHGFIISRIDGLGPPVANIYDTAIATMDGTIYNSARTEKRNIVMELIFTDADIIETSRQRSYDIFPIKKPVTLTFETDNRLASIVGYIEKNEPNIFSQLEQTQISIICPDPWFYSVANGMPGGYYEEFISGGAIPLFEFPFENNVDLGDVWFSDNLQDTPAGNNILDSDGNPINTEGWWYYPDSYPKTIEFGEVVVNNERAFYYGGEIPTGVIIVLTITGSISGLTVYNRTTGEYIAFDDRRLGNVSAGTFRKGDQITISTIRGQKYARLTRETIDGRVEIFNIHNAITMDSKWLTIVPGTNVLGFHCDNGDEYVKMRIRYRLLYTGI